MPRGFFGRRDGVRNGASELEGCLGIKIGNAGCSLGCVVLFGIVAQKHIFPLMLLHIVNKGRRVCRFTCPSRRHCALQQSGIAVVRIEDTKTLTPVPGSERGEDKRRGKFGTIQAQRFRWIAAAMGVFKILLRAFVVMRMGMITAHTILV